MLHGKRASPNSIGPAAAWESLLQACFLLWGTNEADTLVALVLERMAEGLAVGCVLGIGGRRGIAPLARRPCGHNRTAAHVDKARLATGLAGAFFGDRAAAARRRGANSRKENMHARPDKLSRRKKIKARRATALLLQALHCTNAPAANDHQALKRGRQRQQQQRTTVMLFK